MLEEFKNNNDYSVTVFSGSGFLAKYTFVQSPYKLSLDLAKYPQFDNWVVMNVYVRRSKRLIGQFKRGAFIPHKPR